MEGVDNWLDIFSFKRLMASYPQTGPSSGYLSSWLDLYCDVGHRDISWGLSSCKQDLVFFRNIRHPTNRLLMSWEAAQRLGARLL